MPGSTLKNLKDATSLKDLAQVLNYKAKTLSFITYKIPDDLKYREFEIPKKSGGVRKILAPEARLKRLQRSLADVLYLCCSAIDANKKLRPLSHGFREGRSIVSNARPHARQRYVLNLDLLDFFPSLNFGRVRGFFIKNRDFALNEKVATIIAQIACFKNGLPQGSPCSPIIADLIAHILDVRLARLAKRVGATYTRYADDLTFSTRQMTFPTTLAAQVAGSEASWALSEELIATIENAGFAVNDSKTRMQVRASRQLVTGLTVNAKVNTRAEYYRAARAMAHSLFNSGRYFRPVPTGDASAEASAPDLIDALRPLEGILSHILFVKNSAGGDKDEKKDFPIGIKRLYARFLFYQKFVALERPIVICEGKTDSVYLKLAIQKLPAFQPMLGNQSGNDFKFALSFFNYGNQSHKILDLYGGVDPLKTFLRRYPENLRLFRHRPLKAPVIVLIDNDDGASEIFKVLRSKFKLTINPANLGPFFHLTDNLYVVSTPPTAGSQTSTIEDFFEPAVLAMQIEGKKFNGGKKIDPNSEYGKVVFAERIVRQHASAISFAGFTPLLEQLVAVLGHYKPPVGLLRN